MTTADRNIPVNDREWKTTDLIKFDTKITDGNMILADDFHQPSAINDNTMGKVLKTFSETAGPIRTKF